MAAAGQAPIRAVFFDMDDTLVLTSKLDLVAVSRVEALARTVAPGADIDRAVAAWRRAFAAAPWDDSKQIDVEEWRSLLWARALVGAGFPAAAEEAMAASAPAPHPSPLHGVPARALAAGRQLQDCFSRSRLDTFRLADEVVSILSALRKAGVATAIITNGHSAVQNAKLEACGAAAVVDHILVGGDEIAQGRAAKPHASIFRRAAELCGCEPEEALMVGDSFEADVVGARRAGVGKIVWINADEVEVPETYDRVVPDAQVASLDELPGLLKSWGVVV